MEDREKPQMRKYGESKMTRIMMATVPHVTSGSGLRKFQADGFLFDRVYINMTTIQRFKTSYSCYVVLDSCVIPSQEVVHQTEMWPKSNLLHDFS